VSDPTNKTGAPGPCPLCHNNQHPPAAVNEASCKRAACLLNSIASHLSSNFIRVMPRFREETKSPLSQLKNMESGRPIFSGAQSQDVQSLSELEANSSSREELRSHHELDTRNSHTRFRPFRLTVCRELAGPLCVSTMSTAFRLLKSCPTVATVSRSRAGARLFTFMRPHDPTRGTAFRSRPPSEANS